MGAGMQDASSAVSTVLSPAGKTPFVVSEHRLDVYELCRRDPTFSTCTHTRRYIYIDVQTIVPTKLTCFSKVIIRLLFQGSSSGRGVPKEDLATLCTCSEIQAMNFGSLIRI